MVADTRRLGLAAATYEINDDSVYQNMLDPLGFCFALSLCIRLFKKVGMKGLGQCSGIPFENSSNFVQ